MVRLPRRTRRLMRRLFRDCGAVSAVEFALVFPLMLTLYLGGSEVGNGLSISREVSHVASTLGDLVGQCSSISNADMNNIMAAAVYVIAPYATTDLTIRLSGISTDSNSKATVA